MQIHSKVVRLDFANTVHVAYLGVVRIDDLSVIVEKRFRLFQERAEAASQVIASSIAAVELHFAFRTGQRKRFGLCRFIAGRKCASETRAGIDDRRSDGSQIRRRWLGSGRGSGWLSRFRLF